MKKRNFKISFFIFLLSIILVNIIKFDVFAQTTTPKGFEYAIKPQFDMVHSFSEGLAVVRDHGKYGFIDKTGKILIKPEYDKAYDFSDGIAKVYVDGKYRFIDKTGKTISKPQLDLTFNLNDAKEKFSIKDKASDHNINVIGNSNGTLGIVKVTGKSQYMLKSGELVIKNDFDNTYTSSNGLSIVYDGGIDYFKEGFAKLCINGKWGFIDKSGKILCKPQFDWVNSFSDGLAMVKAYNKYGFINNTGKIICEPQFDWVDTFSEGMAMFRVDSKYGFIDKTGKIVIKSQFDAAGSFSEGLASVYVDGKWGFIKY
ncbi:WG repeat-containing protein [Clostridium sp.]